MNIILKRLLIAFFLGVVLIVLYTTVATDQSEKSPLEKIKDPALANCISMFFNKGESIELERVINLSCNDQGIKTLDGIEQFKSLVSLELKGNPIFNIGELSRLQNLEELYFGKASFRNLNEIGKLVRLKKLSLSQFSLTPKLNDFSDLSNLTQLEYLYLAANDVTELSFLSNMHNLIELNLSFNSNLELITLPAQPKLTILNATYSNITDLSSLRKAPLLQRVSFFNNKISDLTPLSNLGSLTDISLSNNEISNINALGGIINLQRVSASKNFISDVEPLRELHELKYVQLDNNDIGDLTPLIELTNLSSLSIKNNDKLNCKDYLWAKKNLNGAISFNKGCT